MERSWSPPHCRDTWRAIEALRIDRLAGALSVASERRGSSAGRIGLRSGLHFEVGNSRDLTKKLELAIMPSVRKTPTDGRVECFRVVDLTMRLFGSSRLVVTGELNGVSLLMSIATVELSAFDTSFEVWIFIPPRVPRRVPAGGYIRE